MNVERLQRAEPVLSKALELEPSQRAAFLDRACGDDRELRRDVEMLLAHEADADRVLAGAVEGSAALFKANHPGMAEGERIGPYRILREIGRGGMGTVYLAERDDDQFQKRVAIKVVTRGMDTALLLDRFRHERQILARLEHPYIARLHDGGSTADGQPYLVMEYIEGEPITAWCDARQLPLRERIELFCKVCAAVQEAHQNLVVHRDLKPANILVDSSGVPKLLDFGIAKLLGPDDTAQVTIAAGGMQMLTPDYASPEQVRGGNITTAADIYALGAILYELITGVRPHRLSSYTPAEIEQAICQDGPAKPSTAARQAAAQGKAGAAVRNAADLDSIILMAMRKEPARRYHSAAEFSEDLARYLNDLPVQARPDTLLYRAARFTRRHAAGVAAALLVTTAIAAGATLSTIEGRRAQRRFNEVRRIAHAVLYDIHDAMRDLPGSTKAREVVVKTALEYLNGLAGEAAGDIGLQIELAEAYERVGDVQGNAIDASLGQSAAALDSYRKAKQIADQVAHRQPGSPKAAVLSMSVRERMGDLYARQRGDLGQALSLYREGIQMGESTARKDPSNLEIVRVLSSLYTAVARDETNSERSIEMARKALPLLEQLASAKPHDEETSQSLSDGYSVLGRGLMLTNQLQESYEMLRRAAGIREKLAAAHPDNARYQRQLMIVYSRLGDVLGPVTPSLEDAAGASHAYGKVLEIAERLAAADPANARAAFDRGMAMIKAGFAMPDAAAGEAMLEQALSVFQGLAKADPSDRRLRQWTGNAHAYLAQRYWRAGQTAEAVGHFRTVIRLDEELLENGSKDTPSLRGLWRSYQSVAKIEAADGKRDEALDHSRKAIVTAEKTVAVDPNPVNQAMLPEAYGVAGEIRARFAAAPGGSAAQHREDWGQAAEAFRKSSELWEKIQPLHGWPKERDSELARTRSEAARCSAALAGLR